MKKSQKLKENIMKNKIALFYSSTCEPCTYQKPLIEKIAKEHKIELELISIETKEGFEFAQNFGVKGFPYTLFIVDDVVKAESIGYDIRNAKEENEKSILKVLKELNFIN
jgi:thiol-disulfide isomerase/thioredoxin